MHRLFYKGLGKSVNKKIEKYLLNLIYIHFLLIHILIRK